MPSLKKSLQPPRERNEKVFKVGVRLPSWGAGHSFRILDGLLDFQRAGHNISIHYDQYSEGDLEPDPIDEHWDGDGLIVYRYSKEEAEAWLSAGVAVVNLSTVSPNETPNFPVVTMDNEVVAKMAYDHLSLLGLKDFAYIHESSRIYSQERLKAFRQAVLDGGGQFHQIDVPVSTFPVSVRPQKINECLREPLMNLPRPCGILAKDDIAGIFTLRLLEKLGILCPDEMPVLGIMDDIGFCHAGHPPLSSISYPARKIGYIASELLMQMMLGEAFSPDFRMLVPPSFFIITRINATRHSRRRVCYPRLKPHPTHHPHSGTYGCGTKSGGWDST